MEWWIKLWRNSQDNKMYFSEPFTRRQAWQDLILTSNHKDWQIVVRWNYITIKRGQNWYSEETFAKRRQWSRGKVRRYLSYLETVQQIVQQKSKVKSLITIINREKYQWNGTSDGTTDGHQTVQQTDTNKKDKKDKNVKEVIDTQSKIKSFVPPTVEQVVSYFVEQGYIASVGRKAWAYYDAWGWTDSKGNKIKNRKQKMQGVWFKEENKDKTKSRGLTEAQRQERLNALPK